LVKERLDHYENISKFYSLDYLQSCSNKAPFYCHYLGWRLGTWESEELFRFFDALLANAVKLPNWKKDRIPQGCEFENFWSFVWELQVAQLFASYPNTSLEWTNSGPDLKVGSKAGEFFVECTIYRKSFGLEEFINELLDHIHPWIDAKHVPFNIFSLPKDKDVGSFLDTLFRPLLDEKFLQEKIREAAQISPVILPTPEGVENLYVFIENDNAKDSSPNRPWIATGSPEDSLEVIVKEVLDNKRESNGLKSHRPNLLAANLLLGQDYQLATALRTIPTPDLGAEFDAVFLTACGIDAIPSLNNNRLIYFYDSHPIKGFLNQ
jgi:hypothetical protein